jgi:hypothetical protein
VGYLTPGPVQAASLAMGEPPRFQGEGVSISSGLRLSLYSPLLSNACWPFFKIDPHLEHLREKAEFKRLVADLEYKYTALKIQKAWRLAARVRDLAGSETAQDSSQP